MPISALQFCPPVQLTTAADPISAWGDADGDAARVFDELLDHAMASLGGEQPEEPSFAGPRIVSAPFALAAQAIEGAANAFDLLLGNDGTERRRSRAWSSTKARSGSSGASIRGPAARAEACCWFLRWAGPRPAST